MVLHRVRLADTARQAVECFREQFHRLPTWQVAAPGRVNLIGEHTDYNQGFVFPLAIDRYTVLVAGISDELKDRNDLIFRVRSMALQVTCDVRASASAPHDAKWTEYLRGVWHECRKRGMNPPPLQLVIASSVPVGSGLSSSAALEVATATLLEAACQTIIPPIEKALLCQRAEHCYAGVPCGIMDQYASVMGQADHLMLIDCRDLTSEMVPLMEPTVELLITNSHVEHALGSTEYAKRREECEQACRDLGVTSLRDSTLDALQERSSEMDPITVRRARHVLSEISRTQTTAEAIRKRQWVEAGQQMYASHASLRDDYQVSCPELDLLVNLAQDMGIRQGVYGARMTGAGFGGCTITLVRASMVSTVAENISEAYERRTGIRPTLFVTRPARGAHLLG